MVLTDLLTPQQLQSWHDQPIENREDAEVVKRRIAPIVECFRHCMQHCGPLTDDPEQELAVITVVLACLDSAIKFTHDQPKS